MFFLRGFLVSCSMAVIMYVGLSAIIGAASSMALRVAARGSAKSGADFLFLMRLSPLLFAMLVTVAFVVPSFLLLEPQHAIEPFGFGPLLLSIAGFLGVAWGLGNGVGALRRADRQIRAWTITASSFEIQPRGAFLLVSRAADVPPLAAAGILKPKILVARETESVLNERELRCALRHEREHVRRHDNLRKLLLRLIPFPGTGTLEQAWREASEMAADDAAVSNASEAVDLAAALVKLSRSVSLQPPAELTTALVHSPASAVNSRVERLLAWKEPARPRWSHRFLLSCSITAVVLTAVASVYPQTLFFVHSATEWLVR